MEENKFTTIRQPYAITMAKHHLNVHEFRIMTRIIEALQPNMVYDKDRTTIQHLLTGDIVLRLPINNLFIKGSENHSRVKKALKTLEQKVIYIRRKDSSGEYETDSRLIMKSKKYLNNQMVAIYLDHDLVPDMLALAKNYSQYLLEVAFNSSSVYVAKLYQFISHWKDKTRKSVMLDELREWLDLGDKYEKSKDLRKRILEPASIELKQRADVWFEIDKPIKLGKSITGYVLKIYRKPTTESLKMAYIKNVKDILQTLFELGNYHLNKLESIINRPELRSHIIEKIQEIHRYIQMGNVKHVKSYVVKSILNEFSNNQLELESAEKSHDQETLTSLTFEES